jgi:hypothetical protein
VASLERSPKSLRRERGLKLIILGASFALPLLVYAWSLDSDVGFWDTAEMNTVPYILGLAHPTGFPTEILLGWLFSHGFSVGEVTFRLTLFNALEVAGAACLAAAFVLSETRIALIPLLAAIGFATSFVVWQHAIHTDVTSIAVLLVGAVFVVIRRWWKTDNPRLLLVAALIGGAALGTHGAAALYLVAPAVLVLVRALQRRNVRKPAAMAALVFLVCITAIYAYLPLRSAYVVSHRLDPTLALGMPPGRPFWDWGDPRSWSGFRDVAFGSQVSATRAFEMYVRPSALLRSLTYATGMLKSALGGPTLATILIFCIAACFDDLPLTLFLLAPALIVTPFVLGYIAESDPARYYIFPSWGLWTAASIGLAQVLERLRVSSRWSTLIVAALIALITLHNVYAGRGLFVERRDRLGFNYIDAVIAQTRDNSVLIAPWTYATPIAYAGYVQHRLGSRVLVPGEANDLSSRIRAWMRDYPVFAVSEYHPSSRLFEARYICNFNVIPKAENDPKLYRILPPQAIEKAHPAGATHCE